MAACTVLRDSMVRQLLLQLSRDQCVAFLDRLEGALISFSDAKEKALQPDPSVITRPDGRKTLFRPFTSDAGPGVKIIVDPTTKPPSNERANSTNHDATAASAPKETPTLHGILALCNRDGLPIGLINAEEITAFRTALSVMIPYMWRKRTRRIVIFGAGKVALWHVRLILRLRGSEVEDITIVNRSAERSAALTETIKQENPAQWGFFGAINILDARGDDHESSMEETLQKADIVFCTTPSKTPLFPLESLFLNQKERWQPFISGIGSWTSDMVEIAPDILSHASETLHHDGPKSRGMIVVDDREVCLRDAGEIVQADIQGHQISEVGELLALRTHDSDRFSDLSVQYLADGLLVYKSIGVSMTDYVAGKTLLELAADRQIGMNISDF